MEIDYIKLKPKVCALVNRCSGERQAADFVFKELCRILGPNSVHDLNFLEPSWLASSVAYLQLASPEILFVAGGDGTVALAFDLVNRASGNSDDKGAVIPFISIIPMGTGNDLSRCLGFGSGFSLSSCCHCSSCCHVKSLEPVLERSMRAPRSMLDQWLICIKDLQGSVVTTVAMTNYFSIGLDAKIANSFDSFRRLHPTLCDTRGLNKVWYAYLGCKSLCGEPQVSKHLSMKKGTNLEEQELVVVPNNLKSIVFSNINSFAGGTKLWKDKNKRFSPLSISDRQLEVQGIFGSVHMGLMQMHLRHAEKITHGNHFHIRLSFPLCCQVDGEALPCAIAAAEKSGGLEIEISFLRQTGVLDVNILERNQA